MTKHECEMELFKLAKRMREVYKEYDKEGVNFSVYSTNEVLNIHNDYWERGEEDSINIFFIDNTSSFSLALDIDELMYQYDTYEYKDQYNDRLKNVDMMDSDIKNKNIEYIKKYLEVIYSDGDEDEKRLAKEYMKKLDIFML